MAFVTRFKRRIAGGTNTSTIDGPVSGSIIMIPVVFGDDVAGGTAYRTIDLPAGMALKLVAIIPKASSITSDPEVTVGSAVDGAQFVAAANVVDGTALTLVATDVTDLLSFKVVNDAGDAYSDLVFTVVAYVSAPPTSLVERNINHA